VRYAFYLGCTVPVRAMNYELSARRTAERLGIEFVDLEGFTCCGYPAKPLNWEAALLMAANNLALAEEEELHICALCSACTGTLVHANKRLQQDQDLRDRINQQLADATGRRYRGTVTVRHYARILYEDIGLEQLRDTANLAQSKGEAFDLSSFGFAAHYGCHYLKPADIYDGFEDPENPHTLGDLIEVTGAQLVPYDEEAECCGGGILAIDQESALSIAKSKLDHVHATEADGLVLLCPFCDIMYEINQRAIERQFGTTYRLPVLFYPQLLGLALGFTPEELGFKLNRVKATAIIRQFAERHPGIAKGASGSRPQ
jgi:heterodisulfide reductase subunit B